ncbi:MAG TPA: D-aminoacyl-tRNA deacylase [Bacteroidota bacterium]|nr:D-aminoacyl-tRNA deacylase [Bacteroidota bacterium]
MRAVVQRVTSGAVAIDGVETARIGKGYVILLGVGKGDTASDARALASRCAALRVMEDEGGKMNLALADAGGSALVVSQFTLYGDTSRGNRPAFTGAAPADEAAALYEEFIAEMRRVLGNGRVAAGVFRAMMSVTIVNDGPVTVLMEYPTHNQLRSASS